MISRDSTKLCLFPVAVQVVVWRRYNDIKRLYKALSIPCCRAGCCVEALQ